MASVTLTVFKDSPVPWAKLTLSDNHGRISWQWIPIDQGGNPKSGYVEKKENNYDLIRSDTKKSYGTLINFSLYNYHPDITYYIKTKKGSLRCKADNEFLPLPE